MDFKGKAAFDVAGRLVSLAVLAFGLLALGWSAAVALWGFWIEEVITLVFLLIRLAALARARHRGLGEFEDSQEAKEARGGLAGILVLLFFPLVHIIFIIVFMFFLDDHDPAASRMAGLFLSVLRGRVDAYDLRALAPLLEIGAFLILWAIIDLARDLRGKGRGISMAAINLRARSCLVLPHLTIIAGGFLMMALRARQWLAWAVILVKALFEILLLPAMKKESEAAAAGAGAGLSGPAAAGGEAAVEAAIQAPEPRFGDEG